MINDLDTSEMIPIENGEIFVKKVGEGKPMILIHAGFSDHRDWTYQLKDFGQKYLTISYDQRGSGKSSSIKSSFSPTEDLKAITKYLKIKNAVLVGHSIGGTIALDFALQYPELVSALILVASGINGYSWSNEYLEVMKEIWNDLDPKKMTEKYLSAYFYEVATANSNIRTEISKITQDNFAKVLTWETFDANDVQWYFPNPIAKLKEFQVPTMVVYGDKDSADIKEIANILNKKISNVETHVLTNTDHFLNFEKPNELNNLILNSLLKMDI